MQFRPVGAGRNPDAVADIVRIGTVCIGAWSLVDVWIIRLFHVKHKFSEKIVKYKPKAK